MARHALERIADQESALHELSRRRPLTDAETLDLYQLQRRRAVAEYRLIRQIDDAREKLARLERIFTHVFQ